jgi:hypothetical protein
MDSLECEIDKEGRVAVKWQDFLAGVAGKVAKR